LDFMSLYAVDLQILIIKEKCLTVVCTYQELGHHLYRLVLA